MATPPREGWDGEKAHKYGNKELAENRTRRAQEAGYETYGEWVAEKEAASRYSSICGRLARQSGEPCGQAEAWGVEGKTEGACRRHGGKSPQGRAHPAYRHGRHVETTFPKGIVEGARELVEHFEQSPQDTLRENKAVLRMLRNELLEEIEAASGPTLRSELSDVFDGIRQAGDRETVQAKLSEAYTLVRSGVEADAARERCLAILQELRRTADAERRLFVDMHGVVEKARLLALVDEVGRVVDQAVNGTLTADTIRQVAEESSDADDFARRLARPIRRRIWSGLGELVNRDDDPASLPPSENGGSP